MLNPHIFLAGSDKQTTQEEGTMKRIMGVIALAVVLMVPATSFAAGDQIGVYVSPKFIYSYTQMNNIKDGNRDAYLANLAPGATASSGSIGSKSDDTFGGSIAIGYDFDKRFGIPIRTELEYAGFSSAKAQSYERVVAPSGDDVEDLWDRNTYRIQTLFLNAYWDIDTGTKFTPYIGAGIGMGFVDLKWRCWGSSYDPADPSTRDDFDDSVKKGNTNFAWNVSAGLGYDITDNWTIDAGYRFVSLGSVKTGKMDSDGVDTWFKTKDLYQHQVSLGVRYTF